MTLGRDLVVAVFGSTGNQGGSTVKSLVDASERLNISKIKCLTRKPNDKKARDLVALSSHAFNNYVNIEPCFCDWSDEKCLMDVLRGVDVVFAMTDYWAPDVMNEDKEYKIGVNIVNSAVANRVKLFIWSSLDDATKISKGKYHIPHFTSKARVDEYLKNAAKNNNMDWIIVKPGTFFTLPHGGSRYATPLKPDTKVPFFDPTSDTGPVIVTILDHPERYYGKSIYMFGEYGSFRQMSALASKAMGKDVSYVQLDDHNALKVGFSKELIDMFHYFDEFGYFQLNQDKSQIIATSIVPNMITMSAWLGKNI